MSEIKGQLLGILLVLIIFGAVAGGLKSTFTSLEDTIETEVTNLTDDLTS